MRETPMWRRYLRFLGADAPADAEDELAFHLAMRTDDLVRQGLPEPEARARAEREFGDIGRVRRELRSLARERTRGRRRVRLREALGQDLRLALRQLRRSPGFAVLAVLTLAVGIGLSTSMYSVMRGVLLRELPVREQGAVVVAWTRAPGGTADHLPVAHQDLEAFGARSRVLESIAGVAYQGALEQVMRDAGRAFTTHATWVTGDYFRVLGVSPLHGRTLLPTDDVPGAEPVVVIGYGFWQRYFGGDPSAVGHAFSWNGRRYTVVGVLPRGFEYPRGAEVWAPVLPDFPATLEPQAPPGETMVFDVVGRLRTGMDAEHLRAELAAYLRESDARRPAALRGTLPVVTPLPELVVGDARAGLWMAAAAVALLLLVASVNVANLLLIRGAARSSELAVRSALGAGRGRLVRQLLTESALLALLGGVLGLGLALAVTRLLVVLAPPELPRIEMVELDLAVVGFAVLATAAAALLSGLLPAVLAARGDLAARLREGTRTGSAGRGARTLREALVVGQVALAIVVVVGAGLLTRSLLLLQRVDLGFDADRVLVVQTSLPPDALPARAARAALMDRVVDRLGELPGVAGVASMPRPPFSAEGGWSAMVSGEGQTPTEQATNPMLNLEVVGPEYFRTLQIALVAGRPFDERDGAEAARVAIVSEVVARHVWPGEDALGKRIKLGPPDGPGEWHTVVGVVAETRYRELTAPQPSLYLPIPQFGGPVPMSLVIRARADSGSLLGGVRRVLGAAHPELALVHGGTLRQHMAKPLARPRFNTLLLGSFAAVTLLLAAVGIYGAMAATVRQRSRELGIRLALGARPEQVRTLVLRQGLRLAIWGAAIGAAGALLGAQAVRSMLFGVGPRDPATFALGAGLILVTALVACYEPARRAGRVDPAHALRGE